jgi:CMP/dCMP kinase
VISRVVVVSGPPGSGKSTAGRRVAERLGLAYRSVGDLFRAEAKRHGMDVEAFNRYAEAHPEVDRALDDAMQALAAPGILLDGRIQGELARRRGVKVFEILVTADPNVRIQRVAARDGQTLAEATRRVQEREASERARYAHQYQIDIDRVVPDLTVDTTAQSREEVADAIVEFLRTRDPAGVP